MGLTSRLWTKPRQCPDTWETKNVIYYFKDQAGVKELATVSDHTEAKEKTLAGIGVIRVVTSDARVGYSKPNANAGGDTRF